MGKAVLSVHCACMAHAQLNVIRSIPLLHPSMLQSARACCACFWPTMLQSATKGSMGQLGS